MPLWATVSSQSCCQPWKQVIEHTALALARWHHWQLLVHMSCILVTSTIQGWQLFCSELPIVQLYYLRAVSDQKKKKQQQNTVCYYHRDSSSSQFPQALLPFWSLTVCKYRGKKLYQSHIHKFKFQSVWGLQLLQSEYHSLFRTKNTGRGGSG